MLRHAQVRRPGAAVCRDAARLAVAGASIDTLTMVWLLHLAQGERSRIWDLGSFNEDATKTFGSKVRATPFGQSG